MRNPFARRRMQRNVAAPRLPFSVLRDAAPARLHALLAGDPAEAAAWIDAAARYGLVEAQVRLGQILLDGVARPRDPAAALQWFTAAANSGDPAGLNMRGRCLELGWGTPIDLPAAAACYRRAAEQGLDWAQFNLANLLLHGLGMARDRVQARGWYELAAEQGHAKSMNLLGRFCEEGWDMPVDLAAAHDWYRRAAEAGDFRGQYNHAVALAQDGRLEEACDWLRAAMLQGSPDFLAAAGTTLTRHPDERLRAIGRSALLGAAPHQCA